MSEILVGSIEEASHQIGLSQFFVGVFVVAIVGNAAEHYVAVVVAIKNKMDLAVNIAIAPAAQIALFVAPVLVLLSFFFGPYPMALVFNAMSWRGWSQPFWSPTSWRRRASRPGSRACSCWRSISCSGSSSCSRNDGPPPATPRCRRRTPHR